MHKHADRPIFQRSIRRRAKRKPMRLCYAAAVDCAFSLGTIIDDEMISKLGT